MHIQLHQPLEANRKAASADCCMGCMHGRMRAHMNAWSPGLEPDGGFAGGGHPDQLLLRMVHVRAGGPPFDAACLHSGEHAGPIWGCLHACGRSRWTLI
eukprot:366072-Chlamydomonas_euryale.AAC.6